VQNLASKSRAALPGRFTAAPYASLRGPLRFSESRGRYGSIFSMSAERAIEKIAPSLVRFADRPSIPAMLGAAQARPGRAALLLRGTVLVGGLLKTRSSKSKSLADY
jgi:hypothetical protein